MCDKCVLNLCRDVYQNCCSFVNVLLFRQRVQNVTYIFSRPRINFLHRWRCESTRTHGPMCTMFSIMRECRHFFHQARTIFVILKSVRLSRANILGRIIYHPSLLRTIAHNRSILSPITAPPSPITFQRISSAFRRILRKFNISMPIVFALGRSVAAALAASEYGSGSHHAPFHCPSRRPVTPSLVPPPRHATNVTVYCCLCEAWCAARRSK